MPVSPFEAQVTTMDELGMYTKILKNLLVPQNQLSIAECIKRRKR